MFSRINPTNIYIENFGFLTFFSDYFKIRVVYLIYDDIDNSDKNLYNYYKGNKEA